MSNNEELGVLNKITSKSINQITTKFAFVLQLDDSEEEIDVLEKTYQEELAEVLKHTENGNCFINAICFGPGIYTAGK